MSAIDTAHARMQSHPQDDALRLRYYATLADAELILLLEHEVDGTDIAPRVFDLDSGPVVLAFDTEEKLADFVGTIAPYVALPGRVVAQSLAGQGVGLGINLGTASEMLLDADAVAWLAQTLQAAPDLTEANIAAFHLPHVPDLLVITLQDKLRGAAPQALLAGVLYQDGRRGHVLAVLDVAAGGEAALAQSASEALVFSGIEAGEMDVLFLASADPAAQSIAKVGRVLDLVVPGPVPDVPKPPGKDPDRPPRLR
jgi:SseB protein N-terminal domain